LPFQGKSEKFSPSSLLTIHCLSIDKSRFFASQDEGRYLNK
jgi:hypothetical protein